MKNKLRTHLCIKSGGRVKLACGRSPDRYKGSFLAEDVNCLTCKGTRKYRYENPTAMIRLVIPKGEIA